MGPFVKWCLLCTDHGPIREMVFAVHHSCADFVKSAAAAEHPRHLYTGVPDVLATCVKNCATMSYEDLGKDRTATLRKWTLRAQELRAQVDPDPPVGHCAKILEGKDLRLFQEMLDSSGHADTMLPSCIRNGFELMGPLPSSGVLQKKNTFATLTPEEVRANAASTRKAIWNSCKGSASDRVAQEVFRITKEEKANGWLEGPFYDDLPMDAILTRHFGVEQSSTRADGSVVSKVRPVDDYTESQVNLTNSSDETVSPHGVDTIVAGACLRVVSRPKDRAPENLMGCTIDLRKAYKQLAIAPKSLNDAYLCVFDTETGTPAAFRTLVLPFGARAAVNGFCRCSLALFWIGVVLLQLHWTVFFDDFFMIAAEEEAGHIHFVQRGFFELVGWATSSEKESGFQALGVCISFAEIKLGWVVIQNTEHRRDDLRRFLDALIAKGSASSHELTVLRGRLMFADNQVYGRRARQVFSTLSRACAKKKQVCISDELLVALLFFRDSVVDGPPRRVSTCHREKFCIFTDASYEQQGSGLGGILYDCQGSTISWFSEWLTHDMLAPFRTEDKEGLIFELEVFAAVQGAIDLLKDRKHLDIVLFVDNQAALSCLISGKAEGVTSYSLRRLLELEESHDLNFWFEWVPSESNPADAPSKPPAQA